MKRQQTLVPELQSGPVSDWKKPYNVSGMLQRPSSFFPLVLILTLLTGTVSPVFGAENGPLSEALRALVKKKSLPDINKRDWARLQAFYGKRGYEPAWLTDKGGIRYRAMDWRAALRDAEVEGLEPNDYHLQAIETRLPHKLRAERLELELLLTDAFFRYHADVRAGQKDDPKWRIAAPKEDAAARLETLLASEDVGATLKELPPPHQGYRELRQALAQYRDMDKRGGWKSLPDMKLYWGMWHDNVVLLRQHLIMSGDLAAGEVSEKRFFDQNLKQAVEQALRLGEGTMIVSPEGGEDLLLSSSFACPSCGKSATPPTPQLAAAPQTGFDWEQQRLVAAQQTAAENAYRWQQQEQQRLQQRRQAERQAAEQAKQQNPRGDPAVQHCILSRKAVEFLPAQYTTEPRPAHRR